MTKSISDPPADTKKLIKALELDSGHGTHEVLSIAALLDEARTLVEEDARKKPVVLVAVGVQDEVFVHRARIVQVLTSLLRTAVRSAPVNGRVALTGQEFERELVFAIYASGEERIPEGRADYLAYESVLALGGRLWSTRASEGNVVYFSVPLYREHN